jgi:hypothetical protein
MADHLYDPQRGKLVRALPEERVRRQFVDWLIASAGVPARLLAVEYPLSNLDPLSRQRADVVVWQPNATPNGGLSPWLLAECKAPDIKLGEAVTDQVRRYAARVRAAYVLITNGADTRVFALSSDRYEVIEGLPPYPRSSLNPS